jgi:hypothetical protein
MVKTDNEGNYSLSAGEIGTYVVCPQAWHLERVQNVETTATPQMAAGRVEHRNWETAFKEAVILAWASKVIFLLIILLLVFYIFSKMQG